MAEMQARGYFEATIAARDAEIERLRALAGVG